MDLQDKRVIDSGCSRHQGRSQGHVLSYRGTLKEINGGYVAFRGNPEGGKITGKVPRKNNMYSVDLKKIVPKRGLTCLFAKATSDEAKLWHRRLGYLNFKSMNKLVKQNLVRGLPSKLFENDQTRVACQKGKQHRASFVTDDYSRFTWVFLLATKDETSGILKSFITGIENLVDHKVKVIRCDNGTEFKNKDILNQFIFEVGESSSAATARQAGHTLAHIVDYEFIDTMDASIRAAESRAMTAVGVVNDRVTDLATTLRQDAQKFYMRCEDTQDDQALLGAHAMEAQIRALQRDVDVLQRQRIRDEDTLTAHIQHKHDRFSDLVCATEAGLQDGLKDAGVVDALVERNANRSRNSDDSHDSGSDGRRGMHVARECTYSDFLKCQPLNFKELALMSDRMLPEESDEVENYFGGLPDMIHCAPKCTNCNRTEHSAWDCRSQPAAANNNQRAQGANQRFLTCFKYGAHGYFKNNYP
ncbi:putative ribonuclease H-like domain-containing protein [Tanacetum coccineum]